MNLEKCFSESVKMVIRILFFFFFDNGELHSFLEYLLLAYDIIFFSYITGYIFLKYSYSFFVYANEVYL